MKRVAFVQLTWPQVEAVLRVAASVDDQAGDLEKVLPEAGTRAAFRGAITTLQAVKTAESQRTAPTRQHKSRS